jgi:sulfur-oxidizing protein SoxY
MTIARRSILRFLLAASAVAALPRALLAADRPDAAFEATEADDAIAKLFGGQPEPSDAVQMKIPDIAENGAVVPVTISTDLPNVTAISVVVDNNPTPLAASFKMGPKMAPSVSVRIKMGESSNVRAIVQTDSGLYSASKEVKVTIGGCGG